MHLPSNIFNLSNRRVEVVYGEHLIVRINKKTYKYFAESGA